MRKIFVFVFASYCFSVVAQPVYNDNIKALDDSRVNPVFAKKVKQFIDSAKKAGFKPVIHEAFRTKEKAEKLNAKNSVIGRAAAKVSVHSFGLAVDIWLANEKGEVFSFDPRDYKLNKANRFSYQTWLKFIRIGESFGLINAYKHSDTDHWEFHPKWSKTDWINAAKIILPIYNRNPKVTEKEKLEQVWKEAGL